MFTCLREPFVCWFKLFQRIILCVLIESIFHVSAMSYKKTRKNVLLTFSTCLRSSYVGLLEGQNMQELKWLLKSAFQNLVELECFTFFSLFDT